MRKSAFAGLAIAVTFMALPAETVAQRGGGRGGAGGAGGAGGGGMCAGGMGSGGMTGAMASGTGRGMRMGGGMSGQTTGGTTSSFVMLNQLNQMALAQGGTADTAGRRNQRRPTAGQFTRAAMRFDRNDDRQLDEEELRQVASAVMAELRSSRRGRPMAASSRTGRNETVGRMSGTDTNQMQQTFINRAMDFDRNGDGMLNQSETSRMARALIRSLG